MSKRAVTLTIIAFLLLVQLAWIPIGTDSSEVRNKAIEHFDYMYGFDEDVSEHDFVYVIYSDDEEEIELKSEVTEEPAPTPTISSGGLTKEGGVYYFNGRKETWYSSNILYHYRTPEWATDANGVYRDKDGYVVVAASDLAQGAIVETSHGTGKVYDTGCAAGVTDIYTNW